MKKLKDLEIIFSVLLIIAFFLPWLFIGGGRTAYQIPLEMGGIVTLLVRLENERATLDPDGGTYRTFVNPTAIERYTILACSLYLIPLCSAITIGRKGNGYDSKTSSAIAAAIPILFFVFGITLSLTQSVLALVNLGIGAWLSLIAAVGLLLVAFDVIDAIPRPSSNLLFKNPEFLLAALLFISFFLPWIAIGSPFLSINIAGYNIPQIFNTAGGIASFYFAPLIAPFEDGGPGVRTMAALSYGLYLIPFCSLTTLVRQYQGLKSRTSSLTAALVSILVFGLAVGSMGIQLVMQGMGMGAWLSLIAAGGLLIVTSREIYSTL